MKYYPTAKVATDGSITEYRKVIYFSVRRYWIGISLRWAKNKYGQITTSPFNSKMYGIKYIDWGYFRMTISKRNW